MTDSLKDKEEKLDKFAEICLDAVLERYRYYQSDVKRKRSKENYQKMKLSKRTGKKEGKYGYEYPFK